MRRDTLASLLLIATASGCADAPTSTSERPFRPHFAFVATEILDGGGFEGAGNQNIAIETHWAPRGWSPDPFVLAPGDRECAEEGICPIGTMTDNFANLILPTGPTPLPTCSPQNATDQIGSQCFAVISNANFRPNPEVSDSDTPDIVTTLRSAIRGRSPFNLEDPPTVLTAGLEWRMVVDYAFLSSQLSSADAFNDVATITLSADGVTPVAVLTVSRDDLLPGGSLASRVVSGGCGSASFGGRTHALPLCTAWITDTVIVPAALIGTFITVGIAIDQVGGEIVDEEIFDPGTGLSVTRRRPTDNDRASFLAFDNLRFVGGVDQPDVPSPTAPVVTILAATGSEGAAIPVRSTITDPNGTIASFNWAAPAGCAITLPTRTSSRLTCADNGSYTVSLSATDNSGETSVSTQVITVNNVAPRFETGFIGVPASIRTGTTFPAAIEFSDAGSADSHNAAWTFTGGAPVTGTVIPASAAARARVEDILTAPPAGLRTLRLQVTDDDGGQRAITTKVAVFDPLAGHVVGTATGHLYGTPVSVDATVRYANPDATSPVGWVVITAPAKGIDRFEATTLSYLLVTGTRATIEGVGTRNGEPGYAFTLIIDDPAGTTKPVQARFSIREVGVKKGFVYDSPFFPVETGDLGIRAP